MIFWVSCCQNVNSPLSVLVPLVYNWWAKSSVQPLCLGTASVPLTRAGWEGPSIVQESGWILYTGTRHTCSRDTGICQASVLSSQLSTEHHKEKLLITAKLTPDKMGWSWKSAQLKRMPGSCRVAATCQNWPLLVLLIWNWNISASCDKLRN